MRRYTVEINREEFVIDVQEITANQFYVLVNGQEFEVTLASGSDLPDASITPQIVPVERRDPKKEYKPVAFDTLEPLPRSPQPALPAKPQVDPEKTRTEVIAPMPGTILEIRVKEGEKVALGQPLAVLEAMKMKNVIKAPVDGVVKSILVSAGQAVNYSDVLIRFEAG